MVKPALAYLDVIRRAKAETGVPHGRVQRLRRVRHGSGGRSRMDRGPGRHADPDGDPTPPPTHPHVPRQGSGRLARLEAVSDEPFPAAERVIPGGEPRCGPSARWRDARVRGPRRRSLPGGRRGRRYVDYVQSWGRCCSATPGRRSWPRRSRRPAGGLLRGPYGGRGRAGGSRGEGGPVGGDGPDGLLGHRGGHERGPPGPGLHRLPARW